MHTIATIDRFPIEDAADLTDVAVRPVYSGRGMYGAECFGVVHETPAQLLHFFVILGSMRRDIAQQLAEVAAQDSMGFDTITYFPGYKLDVI